MQQARRQTVPGGAPAAEGSGPPVRLDWTPEVAERFWRAAYHADLAAAKQPRRIARHFAAILAQRLRPGAAAVTLGDRDSEYAAALLLAGFRVARLDTGPLLRGQEGALAAHPGWGGTLAAGNRTADLVVLPDALAQVMDDEIPPLLAAARSALRPGGRLAVLVPNAEDLDQGLALCPATGTLFHQRQQMRAFTAGTLRALLNREGFRVSAMIEAQPDEAGFQSLDIDGWLALASGPRVRFGRGGALIALAVCRRGESDGDAQAASRWLAARRAVAAAAAPPALTEWLWTPDRVGAFWSRLAGSPLNALSFGLIAGVGLLAALEPFLVPGGRHLDIGAGEGEMARIMAEAGYPVAALEPSAGRRQMLAEKLRGSPGYLGSFEAIDGALAGSFDVAMAFEVVEHVLSPALPAFFATFDRALAPGGRLLLTTPNREDLQESAVASPEAAILFHRWQHMRAFDADSLAALLAEHGFAIDAVHEIDTAALMSGASPSASLALAGEAPVRLGNAGTLLAVARRAADRPRPPRNPVGLKARIIAPGGKARVAATLGRMPGAALLRHVLHPLVRGAMPVFRRARPLLRRALPVRARRSLVRMAISAETDAADQLGDAFARRPARLKELAPLLNPEAFHDGPIVLVNTALASGGAERQIVMTLKGLAAHTARPVGLLCLRLGYGADLNFFLPALRGFSGFVRDAAGIAEARRILAGAEPQRLDRARQAIAWLPADMREEIERLAADFLQLRPAVVHGWQDAGSIAAAYAARIVGVPRIIVSGRNMAPTHFAYARSYMVHAYREIADIADIAMINNSAAGAADYAQWLDVPPQRISVLRNGIDPGAFVRPDAAVCDRLRTELGIPAGARVVGSMFRFEPEKRPLLWVDVAASVGAARPDCHFVIVGDGELRGEALDRARRCGLGDRLHAPGVRSDATAFLALFDVLVLTSRFEGTPNVVIEASLAGVPVVATESGGTAEAIEDGVSGHIIHSAEAATIAGRIEQVLDDRAWRERARQAGPEFVRHRFGVERMIEETVALYGL